MKTGRDVLERALRLLNYTDADGRLDGRQFAELYQRGLSVVNQIYSDLWFLERRAPFTELAQLERPLMLSARCVNDIFPYGVAMLLAQTEGDGDNQLLFANLYNQKRSAAKGLSRRRQDVLPRGWGG